MIRPANFGKTFRYGSLCSGIDAVQVAWEPFGWHCAWTSEIDPFPIAVVEHHFGSPNLGDMTKITKEMINEQLDLMVAGTPCQSFSVAGLRQGMADPRGNLALRFIQLAAVVQPRWILWENVPGILSSNQGRDFGTFLRALEELGYGWAYRTLDAQWFGVAQHRERLFAVGYLGDWRRAAAVLFERESVFGNPPTRSGSRQESAGDHGGILAQGAGTGESERQGVEVPTCVAFHCNARGSQLPSCTRDTSIADSLTTSQRAAVVVGTGEVAGTLTASRGSGFRSNGTLVEGMAIHHGRPRRLTPRECERLMGFPDDYTAITFRKKPAADAPRYKALGNSMVVPVVRWIGHRIAAVDALGEPATTPDERVFRGEARA
jgi:DNA (cytosine-5)-methyltransferase 1